MSTFDGSPVVVGRYNEEYRSFLNIVKESDRFRTHDAYGFDEPAVEELKKLGCLEIELQITGGNRYRIDFQTFLKQARRIDWSKRDEPRFPARLFPTSRMQNPRRPAQKNQIRKMGLRY